MVSYLVLMPCTYAPYRDACLDTLAPEIVERTLVIDNTVENKGAAGSYNIGARHVLEHGLDWLITLSPSTRFGPSAGRDFIERLATFPDAFVVEPVVPVGWHFIAWHRRTFETIGLWDENFWPVYGEDADIAYRINTHLDFNQERWPRVPLDAWLTMQGYSAHKGGIAHDQQGIWAYYERKWGGRSGHEQWKHPFNDERNPLSYWVPEALSG